MFKLAGDLGYTVDELGQRLSSRELSEWMALAMLEAKEDDERQKQQSMASATAAGTQTIQRALKNGS